MAMDQETARLILSGDLSDISLFDIKEAVAAADDAALESKVNAYLDSLRQEAYKLEITDAVELANGLRDYTALNARERSDAENAVSGAADSLLSVFDFLPKGISEYAKSSGLLSGESLSSELMGKITTVGELESQIVSPVVTTLLNILCFAVIAIVCLILLKILSRFLAKLVTATKIAKKLDSSLGAVFGLLKGIIYVFIIAAVVNVVSCASPSFAEYAANSYICSFASKIIGL